VKKTRLAVAVAALGFAASAHAAELDWNQDVMGQVKEQFQQAKAATRAAAAAPADARQTPDSIEAKPLGEAVINHSKNDWDDEVDLTRNNDGDRVGAEFSSCDPSTEHSIDSAPNCEYLDFAFPQLRVDGKNVYWGDDLVAKIHHGLFQDSVRLEKGYRLKIEKRPDVIDRGFDRDHVARIAVRLEKAAR
jgi:hypothetical protein